MAMLKTGIKNAATITVGESDTAREMKSGELDVFATPSMIALMENTAYMSVAPCLEPGQGTVGTSINVKHLAATPVGMKVTCESELVEIDGRILRFRITCHDEKDLIGTGEHERYIITNDRFFLKCSAKKTDD